MTLGIFQFFAHTFCPIKKAVIPGMYSLRPFTKRILSFNDGTKLGMSVNIRIVNTSSVHK